MPEEFPLDEDGRAVAVHRRVTVRTPGLAGRAIVHEAGGAGTRGAEQTTDALVTALALNEIEEDLTVEILGPRERTATAGTRAAGGPDDIVMEVADPGPGWRQVVLYASEDGAISWHFPQPAPGALTYRIPRTVVPVAEAPGAHRGLTGAIGGRPRPRRHPSPAGHRPSRRRRQRGRRSFRLLRSPRPDRVAGALVANGVNAPITTMTTAIERGGHGTQHRAINARSPCRRPRRCARH